MKSIRAKKPEKEVPDQQRFIKNMGFAFHDASDYLSNVQGIFNKTQLQLMESYVCNTLSIEYDKERVLGLFKILNEVQAEDILHY